MKKYIIAITLIGAVALVAQADLLTVELSYEFSGGTAPGGTAPWLTATFDDGGTPGTVDLLLETTGLTGIENVKGWYFNLDTALDPNALAFSAPTKTGSFTDPTINTGIDAYMADGDGKYDILFGFDISNGQRTRFGAGDAVQYTISGIAGLTASSFDFLSAPSGGQGPFVTAAHVLNTGPNQSGWITVPEPSTALLLGFVALVGTSYRRIFIA